jgi:hypothetical protein
MAKPYLTRENFKENWDNSKTYMSSFFEPLAEFERIARNRPHPSTPKSYPKNTDGTLAGIVDSLPKRIIQQLPSGKVKSPVSTIHSIVADYVLNTEIIPNANAEADAIQKCWAEASKSMSFGANGAMTMFTKHDDKNGADFKLFYVKDGFFQAGRLTFKSCDFFFVRAWYQESDIDSLIAKEEERKAQAKELGEKYEAEWDISALKRVKKWKADKDEEAKSAGEKEHQARVEAIEIIHGLQCGVGAKFYSYAPGLEDFVCEKVNKDPRGKMPIHYMYTIIDFENPLGRGVVEMSGGTQNVIDSMLQSYQYNRALMLAPPLIKRGNFDKRQIKLQPNAVIDMGSDANASLDALKIDTTALNNFSGDYSLFKSQILAFNNNGDTSTSSEVGNPGFSKTQAGVEAQQLKLGVSDNYMRKQFESWWEDVCESMLNIHFANKYGSDELTLDNDTARKLREIDPELVDENNVYVINYDEYNEKLSFEVDASTSDKQAKEQAAENLDNLMARIQGSPILQQIMAQYPEKQAALYNAVVALSGIEDPEKLEVDEEAFAEAMKEQQAAAEQAQMAQAVQQEALQEQMDPNQPIEGEIVEQPMPEEGIQGQLPEEALVSENMPVDDMGADMDEALTDEEIMFAQALQERGYENEAIAQGIAMLQEDVPEEEIINILKMSLEEEV